MKKARSTYDLARKVEAEELKTRTAAGVEKATELKEADDERKDAQARAAKEAKDLDAEAKRLSAEAAKPGADAKELAVKGRKVALGLMKTGSPWNRTAAEVALAGSDNDIRKYLQSGLHEAQEQDERARVERLAEDPKSAGVRKAAQKALEGDAQQVHAFLTTGAHQAAAADYQVRVVQISSIGGPEVKKAARTALDSESPVKLAEFLTEGQYTARKADEQVRAVQLMSIGGPELKAAAEIAQAGPPELMHVFIQTGQYQAARGDKLTATHVADVQHLIAEGAGAAATAQKHAAEAARAAALADKATADADKYAKQAKSSEAEAKRYAAQAKKSANEAEASAARARESAKTARKAQADANQAAAGAIHSATRAQSSYDLALGSAANAWTAVKKARKNAEQAGKDSKAADKAADEAKKISLDKQRKEEAKWQKIKEEWLEKYDPEQGDDSWVPDWLKNSAGTVFNYGKAILTNGDFWAGLIETGVGAGMMVGGSAGDIGGGGLCITGVGCLAGAPAIAASTSLIVSGAYTAADGAGRLGEGLNTALNQARSTGRTSAGGQNEQRAMDLVKEYPEYGNKLPLEMKDPRWPAKDGWVKMEQFVDDIEIHYVYNTRTRAAEDFKFKDRSAG